MKKLDTLATLILQNLLHCLGAWCTCCPVPLRYITRQFGGNKSLYTPVGYAAVAGECRPRHMCFSVMTSLGRLVVNTRSMNRYSLSSLAFSVHLVTVVSSWPDRLSGTATVSTRINEPGTKCNDST